MKYKTVVTSILVLNVTDAASQSADSLQIHKHTNNWRFLGCGPHLLHLIYLVNDNRMIYTNEHYSACTSVVLSKSDQSNNLDFLSLESRVRNAESVSFRRNPQSCLAHSIFGQKKMPALKMCVLKANKILKISFSSFVFFSHACLHPELGYSL